MFTMPKDEALERENVVLKLVCDALSDEGRALTVVGRPDLEKQVLTVDALIEVTDGGESRTWAADIALASKKFDGNIPAAMKALEQNLLPRLEALAAQLSRSVMVGCNPTCAPTGTRAASGDPSCVSTRPTSMTECSWLPCVHQGSGTTPRSASGRRGRYIGVAISTQACGAPPAAGPYVCAQATWRRRVPSCVGGAVWYWGSFRLGSRPVLMSSSACRNALSICSWFS